MKTICVFGDSIAWGAWDTEKGGWVERLKLFLWAKDPNTEVYNLGISGDTTADILRRFDIEAEAREPDVIIFAIGVNDDIVKKSDGNNLVEIGQFEKNIREFIKKARKFASDIIILGSQRVDETKTTPIPWKQDYFYYNEEIQKYDKKLQEITRQENVQYIPMFDLLNNEDLEDGLHPNPQGHQKIFEKVKDAIVKL